MGGYSRHRHPHHLLIILLTSLILSLPLKGIICDPSPVAIGYFCQM